MFLSNSKFNKCDYNQIISKCKLDPAEIVSIVFLMCEDPNVALSILLENFTEEKYMLIELFRVLAQCECQDVHRKFIESLILVGNFKAVENLGYPVKIAKQLKEKFSEKYSVMSINNIRKELFLMCEKMEKEELSQMIDYINEDFKKNCCYILEKRYSFMEIYFLYYLSQEYISDSVKSQCDLSKIVDLLEMMNKYDLAKRLLNVASNECSIVTDNEIDHRQECLARNRRTVSPLTNYPMRENKGLCVIVNQRDFSRARSDKFGFRHGTNSDRDLLNITFSGLGYTIKIIENVDSNEFQKSIKSILKTDVQTEHSSFVLCILSHGEDGAVFCTDGVAINIRRIENWMLGHKCPQLISKPKLLIIQACQGTMKQEAVLCTGDIDESNLETDGPKKVSAPLADLLVFNSTVPGYVSFRTPSTGSIFIRSLCLQVLKYPVFDLQDTIIEVNNTLNTKQVGGYITTPCVKHTLTKKIKFVISEKNRRDTACKLFDKYLMDVLFEEYTFLYALFLWERKQGLRPSNLNPMVSGSNT